MLFVTIPHSGEIIPPEASWLNAVPREVLLTDVDRFVHELYGPACEKLGVPWEMARFHRYAVDLNRLPTDIDETFVEIPQELAQTLASGSTKKFVSGFHWVKTTKGDVLLNDRIPWIAHLALVKRCYDEFHARVRAMEHKILSAAGGGARFHIDAHSMPSQGTGAHKDAGQARPDIVVSDCEGKSCSAAFKDLVITAFEHQGFKVSYNWPYLGGRMTEQYGDPVRNHHSVQVELNRALYMDESTREKNAQFAQTASRILGALTEIKQGLVSLGGH